MSVRKRVWTTKHGEIRTSWLVSYRDASGARRFESFERKRDADEFHATVKVRVREGVHTAASQSLTIGEAAEDWITRTELEGRERATVAQYRHLAKHVVALLGGTKLAVLTTPRVHAFRDELLAKVPRPTARKALTALKAILREAQRRGNVAQNVALGVSIGIDKRGSRLKIGVNIPTLDEIRAIIGAASGTARPLLLTLIFCGLRASELRGLRWVDVDLQRGLLHVRQRADCYNVVGKPKSEAGERTIPIPPLLLNILKAHRLQAHPRFELVFPTRTGAPFHHTNIVRQMLVPTEIAAGVVTREGKAKYTRLHALRHFYASLCINRRVDGGLELPAKTVQQRLGHSSIVMTMDIYGHLFPHGDDGAELAVAERALFECGF